jgi:nucleotide-binding universal stress UspA family protein
MRRLLVGLDGSTRAPAVLAAAVAVAKARAVRIFLFRAVGMPPDVPQDFWKTTEEPLLDMLKRRALAYLVDCATHAPHDLLAEDACQVGIGVPWEAICDAARRLRVDLIVVGSHGYSGLDRLLGTTAAKVVNHAPCSVLVHREPRSEEETSEHPASNAQEPPPSRGPASGKSTRT